MPAHRHHTRRTGWHPPINRADRPAHPNRRFVVRGRIRGGPLHTIATVKSPARANFIAWWCELRGYVIVIYSVLVPEDY